MTQSIHFIPKPIRITSHIMSSVVKCDETIVNI